ncbi:MAG: aminotransferase class V-fold PLP-dependent enzyme, partial [Planctomycetales bacterium]|nr:aminotransferase class V-fold PLP-dependent enzyme [Planctomycetales bacterium]
TSARMAALRNTLECGILECVPGAYVNGSREHRLPHVLNIGFPGADGESLVLAFDTEGIAVSSGAACTSGSLEPSHVLLAMGIAYEQAQSAIRFSLGRNTSEAEIRFVLDRLPEIVSRSQSAIS